MRKAVWTALALTSCASGGVHPLRPLALPTVPYVEGAVAEQIPGSLTYEDGCLLFRVAGGERLLPVWPSGSVFNGTSLTFHRPGKADQALLVSEEVEVSGERLRADYVQANFAPYAQRCGGTPFFIAEVRPAD